MARTRDRVEQIFPVLTEEQRALILPFGEERPVTEGEMLFAPGDRNVPFYVILDGELEISQPDMYGDKHIITTHGPGGFTGEINMLSERKNLVNGTMLTAGRVLALSNDNFRRLIAIEADLSELFMRAFILRRVSLIEEGQGNMVLIGSRECPGTLRVQRFLSRNGQPFRYYDIDEDEPAQEIVGRFALERSDLPAVFCSDKVCRNPSNQQLAEALGLADAVSPEEVFDVAVVGAGPAGLASSVYAASEGLKVISLEDEAPGGQAGTSSKIENYLGFPTGISGQALAGRAYNQAQKFGAKIMSSRRVTHIDCDQRPYRLSLEGGDVVSARTVVIATGAQYRKLPLEDMERFEGMGIYYGATQVESHLCRDEEVAVVGGGNSAGQAAVFLSKTAKAVHIFVRGKELAASMSDYLVQRIDASPRIHLHTETEIAALHGDRRLEKITVRDKAGGEETVRDIPHIFVMIGASPNTDWLDGCVELDERGFVMAASDLDTNRLLSSGWNVPRAPYLLETTRPGIFAVGDVRSGSVKRVASAVGEGSVCVQFLHRVVAE